MATIACYKDYALHIDPPAIPVPVCWWPFEVGVTIPWLDTAVPGLPLTATAGSTGLYPATAGKVGVQACRVDTSIGNYTELTQLASTALLNMSLDGFTMTGWVGPNTATMNGFDYFGIRFRAYIGPQVDPYPNAHIDAYMQWIPTFASTGSVEIGLVENGVQQLIEIFAPAPLIAGWHFFVLIYDRLAGKVRYSFDNAALAETAASYTSPLGWTTGAVVFQTRKFSPGTSNIAWDEVNFFNSILAAADINSIYNGGIGTTYP